VNKSSYKTSNTTADSKHAAKIGDNYGSFTTAKKAVKIDLRAMNQQVSELLQFLRWYCLQNQKISRPLI
jgi:hypothetical protein